ncbi:MAG: hypothetical protein MN733_36930, partial [Nitrososphaera sp.]|nr:hypothetical protein [Nitrososphaera sp.]
MSCTLNTSVYAFYVQSLTGDTGSGYSYDANGNRNMSGYQTGVANRVTTDGVKTYTYDAEGNVTQTTVGSAGATWVYTFDHRNQMVSAAYS